MTPQRRFKLPDPVKIEPEDFVADVNPAGFMVCQALGHQPEGRLVGNALVGRCVVCGAGFYFRSHQEEDDGEPR